MSNEKPPPPSVLLRICSTRSSGYMYQVVLEPDLRMYNRHMYLRVLMDVFVGPILAYHYVEGRSTYRLGNRYM